MQMFYKETYVSEGLEVGPGLVWCKGAAGEADTCRDTLLLKGAWLASTSAS
jgi:hypothetical protein